MQTFTERLLMYALGRKLEYYDMPIVRGIVRDAARDDYRFSSFVWGIVQSDRSRSDRCRRYAIGATCRP